ncbi:MAG TPA: type II CAAX endopeptidase family protein [Gemmatimonadales bacterium]|nr:type II CAAX endopeptidase family protein [Gemmatimonadales bacterium]
MVTNVAAKPRLVVQTLWRVALFMLAFALSGAVFIIPFDAALSRWADAFPMRVQLYYDIAGLVAMLAATWVMTRFVDRRRFRTIGFASGTASRDFAAGLGTGVAWLVVSVGVAWAFGWVSPEVPVGFSGSLLLAAAISVFINVLTQQLLLCGYIFQTIRSRANFLVALLVSAGLFSAYHAGAFHWAWLPAVNVFAAGVLFCLAYGITGNLWFPVAIHVAWNLLLGPVLGLTVSGTGQMGLGWSMFTVEGPRLFTGGGFGLEGGLVVTLTTTFFVFTMVLFRSRQRIQERNDNTVHSRVSETPGAR